MVYYTRDCGCLLTAVVSLRENRSHLRKGPSQVPWPYLRLIRILFYGAGPKRQECVAESVCLGSQLCAAQGGQMVIDHALGTRFPFFATLRDINALEGSKGNSITQLSWSAFIPLLDFPYLSPYTKCSSKKVLALPQTKSQSSLQRTNDQKCTRHSPSPGVCRNQSRVLN